MLAAMLLMAGMVNDHDHGHGEGHHHAE